MPNDESTRSGTPAHAAPSFTRRHFLELLGLGAIGVAGTGSALLSAEYLSPNVVKEPPARFKAGNPEDYTPGSVTLDKEQKVFIVRGKEGAFYALSAVCTHLGCIANWKADEGAIACPCHGSRFDREGNVVAGPAPRPLQRYAMSLDDHGVLVVDKSVLVGEDATLKV
jgi:cytochrome b6-f complex iron-sulfur subunit